MAEPYVRLVNDELEQPSRGGRFLIPRRSSMRRHNYDAFVLSREEDVQLLVSIDHVQSRRVQSLAEKRH